MENLLVYIWNRDSTYLWISLALFGVIGLPLLNLLRKFEGGRKLDTSKETIQWLKKVRRIIYSIALGLPMLSLVYGLAWLQRRDHLPAWLKVAQAYVGLGQGYIQWLMALLVRPVFWSHRALAMLQRVLGAGR